jgi:hypothetical protein
MSRYHVDYSKLPEHMRSGAETYVEQGVEPGGFLTAVLCNDFVNAFGKADEINFARMHDWASWLWNEAPSQCWGSREKMNAWISKHDTPAVD